MALFIRDPEVAILAEEVRKATNAKSKTEAVRLALKAQLAEARRTRPMVERLARAKAIADGMGKNDTEFDMKRFSDSMWE